MEINSSPTCDELKCPDHCCTGKPLHEFEIHLDHFCCSKEDYEFEQAHEDSMRAYNNTSFYAPDDDIYGASQAEKEEKLNNFLGNISRLSHFGLLGGLLVAFLLVVLLLVAVWFALRWRKKYLRNKRTSNLMVHHTVNHTQIEDGINYSDMAPAAITLACSSASSNPVHVEMVEMDEEKRPFPDQTPAANNSSMLPAYDDLYEKNSPATNENQE
ncbi:unnamed protein product [Clavelina lepadiformis]|uniref:Uncharacterized protein n=1 Tax=Clavelina lepadiformis TaxID=159417 RepID=A0ABP0FSQ8_CLALP